MCARSFGHEREANNGTFCYNDNTAGSMSQCCIEAIAHLQIANSGLRGEQHSLLDKSCWKMAAAHAPFASAAGPQLDLMLGRGRAVDDHAGTAVAVAASDCHQLWHVSLAAAEQNVHHLLHKFAVDSADVAESDCECASDAGSEAEAEPGADRAAPQQQVTLSVSGFRRLLGVGMQGAVAGTVALTDQGAHTEDGRNG